MLFSFWEIFCLWKYGKYLINFGFQRLSTGDGLVWIYSIDSLIVCNRRASGKTCLANWTHITPFLHFSIPSDLARLTILISSECWLLLQVSLIHITHYEWCFVVAAYNQPRNFHIISIRDWETAPRKDCIPLFFLTNLFEIIIDSHVVVRNNSETMYPISLFPELQHFEKL